jgi:hypothetical protein
MYPVLHMLAVNPYEHNLMMFAVSRQDVYSDVSWAAASWHIVCPTITV